jgi:chromosome segregation ATPase
MVVGIRYAAEQADFDLALKRPELVSQTERQAEFIALEQSLALARREIEELHEALKVRDARAEVSITAALARVELLQEEKIALAAEVVELRGQLAASESDRALEQAKVTGLQKEKALLATEVTGLQKEKALLATEVAGLRGQLADSERARASEQAKVTAMQKEKTSLSAQVAKLRHELATSERKLKTLYSSTSWRITRPLRRVKLPSMWKKTR